MKNHMFYDPFVEHDELQEKIKELAKSSVRWRSTKTKFQIATDGYGTEGYFDMNFTTRSDGRIEVRVHAPCDRKVYGKTYACSAGHRHPVIKRETKYFDIFYFTKKEALALRDFLNERL